MTIPIISLLLATFSFGLIWRQDTQAQFWVRHTFEVRAEIQDVLGSLVNAETGVRGYRLSRQEDFLQPYRTARRLLPGQLKHLKSLVADNPAQSERLPRIESLITQRVKQLEELRKYPFPDGNTSRSVSARLLLPGKSIMDALRLELHNMESEENRLLAERTARTEQLTHRANMIIVGSLLLGLGGGLLATVLFATGVARRVKDVEENAARLAESLPLLSFTPSHDEVGHLGNALEAASLLLAERSRTLRETSALQRAILDSANYSIISTTPDGTIRTFNAAAEKMLGYTAAEVVGEMTPATFHDPQEVARRARELSNELAQTIEPGFEVFVAKARCGETDENEWTYIRKDGNRFPVLLSSTALRGEAGNITGFLGVATDLTERKQAEFAIRRIMEHSLDIICTIDAEGRFVTMSAASEKTWGYRPEELVGRTYLDLIYPDDHQKSNQAAVDVVAGKPTRDFENRYIRKDGSLVPMTWSASWSEDDQIMFCVAHDASERKQAEAAIRYALKEAEEAKAEADRANHAKSEFLSRMSHELRTPMNAILGFAQVLEMEDPTPEQREGLEQILKGGRHLLDLINEVLDIARIEAGRMALSLESVHLNEVIQEATNLVRPLATERKVRLGIAAHCDRHVMADRQRLKQIFLNLLSNAVKYNRENGTVTVSCAEISGQRLQIKITDTGLGIPPQDLTKLFVPFERLQATQTAIEGTGLGLLLSKRMVEAMNGVMGVESTVGEGTTLWVELPLADSPVERHEQTGNGAPVLNTTAAGPTRTVLYIEDNLSNLRLIERILQRHPTVELLSAMQGRLGLDLASQHRPDLILLDLHLPDMQGDEVLRRLQVEPETRTIPVVMISADATPGQIARLREAGAVDYLTKPLDVSRFLEVLENNLRAEEL